MKCAIIGGGAAGFFSAVTLAQKNPDADISIYDSSKQFLRKVKISGGGRCNVTHSCFEPKELALHYPRGEKELKGAFYTWQPRDTVDWFEDRGVQIKTEDDGRMFPVSDNSQSIIDCLHRQVVKNGVVLCEGVGVKSLLHEEEQFTLGFSNGRSERFDRVCVATGSMKSSSLTTSLEKLGHTIEPLAPSLFAFDITDERLKELAGISLENVSVRVKSNGKSQTGPILITHRGLSGPAILKLSAWEARQLNESEYQFEIELNWLGGRTETDIQTFFARMRNQKGQQFVKSKLFDELPRRLWEKILSYVKIEGTLQWAQLPKKLEAQLIKELITATFQVRGKTMNKEEFVTCGGIRLKEVNFKKMESRVIPHLYFAGECLDYDGITGGFNFQGAWTTSYIAGTAMAEKQV
ncbi:MAG: NAD(P)/FAD-dependent oxidoreductase [Opitutae bacterium]|jgi:predicted Rossmann fold flavoprotein|nr:NAD(P)/FAD-dependent oxidoreductase [Opitutae bacterium]